MVRVRPGAVVGNRVGLYSCIELVVADRQPVIYMRGMAQQLDRPFQMRVSDAWVAQIDGWRAKQPGIPSRAEAIRQLVAIGLATCAEISKGADNYGRYDGPQLSAEKSKK